MAGLRTDIQALRAFAVMAVVLYHLWPHRLTGGFVGVDVFFVISGYLITGHLVRQVERTGRVDLGRFWAARARRLLPASLLVLLVTAVAVLLAVPRSLKDQFLSEVLASAAYVQNWRLAHDAVDYLAADNRPSASQHFWSLSVEEQFYVFLPLLVVVTIAVAGLLGARRVRTVFVVLVLVTVASFAYNLHLTDTDPGVAYFSTFTRMWEFGLGGLASFAPPAVRGLSRRRAGVYSALTVAGGLAVIAALFTIDAATPFPGLAAALPVLGTVAVVRWGGATLVAWIGALAPVAMLGRISYALYLWHWPLIVIPPLVTFHALTTGEKLLILVASITIAWASTRFFEEPIRFRLAPRVRPLAVLGVALVAMAPVVVVAGVSSAVIRQDDQERLAATPALVDSSPRCLGAASMDPDQPDCDNPELDGVIVNDPSQVAGDTPKRPGCWSPHGVETLNVCTMGPKTGAALHLFAVGDSHNLALVSAYEKIAEQYHWRIDLAAHAGCPWSTTVPKRDSEEQTASCLEWLANLDDFLADSDFDAILTTHATNGNIQTPAGTTRKEAIVDGLVDAWRTQTSKGVPVIAIVDNPGTDENNVQCVEKFGTSDPDRCAASRAKRLWRFDGNAEAVARLDRTGLVDMTDFYCTKKVCPSVIGGVAVYRDRTHITATYMRTLAPYLGVRLRAALHAQKVI
jgi:peptidoglycan/LPS O-acetylase OafA/YrhL